MPRASNTTSAGVARSRSAVSGWTLIGGAHYYQFSLDFSQEIQVTAFSRARTCAESIYCVGALYERTAVAFATVCGHIPHLQALDNSRVLGGVTSACEKCALVSGVPVQQKTLSFRRGFFVNTVNRPRSPFFSTAVLQELGHELLRDLGVDLQRSVRQRRSFAQYGFFLVQRRQVGPLEKLPDRNLVTPEQGPCHRFRPVR